MKSMSKNNCVKADGKHTPINSTAFIQLTRKTQTKLYAVYKRCTINAEMLIG